MKTKYIEIYERSRLVRASDSERYALRLKLYGSETEIQEFRDAILKMIKEGS